MTKLVFDETRNAHFVSIIYIFSVLDLTSDTPPCRTRGFSDSDTYELVHSSEIRGFIRCRPRPLVAIYNVMISLTKQTHIY
jgi:hypothetical protein